MVTDGAGGKGTWGKLLDTDGESHLDRNDPNYDSGEVIAVFRACILVSNIDYCPLGVLICTCASSRLFLYWNEVFQHFYC